MIARIWHGFTKPEHADAYESHLKPELLPGLSQKRGFRGSHLLRRAVGSEVEFVTIILWDSLDDVRAIATDDYEKASSLKTGSHSCRAMTPERRTMRWFRPASRRRDRRGLAVVVARRRCRLTLTSKNNAR